ncbi:MAG: hypothetical protein IAC13_04395 [Firmicutes bacterium]|uniref:FMN-binding domain-containing protein n=1 Tax=Candidatus Scybalomonas excrementavium TaxID=2840943 RepID=A0A9D9I0Y8_9FIRM|nr:hypothetical protein [Candidatus Scybalomonas excrementavium]
MESKTKIVVLRAKELIYTGIFLVLGIILILVLIFMFMQGKTEETMAPVSNYIPGVYTSSITLGSSSLNVEVTVDKQHVTKVSLSNLDESIETMYPLLEPAISEINDKLQTISSIEELDFTSDNQYTHTILTQAIKNALEKATP